MTTYVDCAGPLGIPAAVIHPDDALPRTWRVVSSWQLDGEHGAYVEWANAPGSWHRDNVPAWAQILYRSDAPRRKSSHVGAAIGQGARQLVCPSMVGRCGTVDRAAAEVIAPSRLAYYDERGQNIQRLDWIAEGLYRINGEPGPADPFTGTPTPPIDGMPEPRPSEDALLVEAEAYSIPHLLEPMGVHRDNPWPPNWRHVIHDGREWAVAEPASWVQIKWVDYEHVLTERGLGMRFLHRRRAIFQAVWEAKNPNPARPAAPAVKAAPAPARRPVEAPPAPSLERARWLGDQVTAMMPRTVAGAEPIYKRRIAARRVLALVAGYEPQSATNDAGTLAGSMSLHLAGLNELARRELEGSDHAVL